MKTEKQSETTKSLSKVELEFVQDDYIEHTYYRLGGALLFKCIVRKDIGDGDFQCMMDGVIRARTNALNANK